MDIKFIELVNKLENNNQNTLKEIEVLGETILADKDFIKNIKYLRERSLSLKYKEAEALSYALEAAAILSIDVEFAKRQNDKALELYHPINNQSSVGYDLAIFNSVVLSVKENDLDKALSSFNSLVK